jgi:hypothetical protein
VQRKKILLQLVPKVAANCHGKIAAQGKKILL